MGHQVRHAANAVPEHTVPVAPQHLAVHVPVGQSIVVRAQVRVLMCRLDITQRAATAVITTVPDNRRVVVMRIIAVAVLEMMYHPDTTQPVVVQTRIPDKHNAKRDITAAAVSETIAHPQQHINEQRSHQITIHRRYRQPVCRLVRA